MDEKLLLYFVPDFPDPLYPQYQRVAGGDVLEAAGHDCEDLLRAVANMAPDPRR